jgi:uncharacterized protein YjbI with pentapeptide repeats
MGPEIEAALIAGGVGILTVVAALYGTSKTSKDTKDGLNKQLTEQREALERTLKEQHDQLDKTLAEQRTRTLNERFATAAGQLGSDKPPAVRLAGVYAMAGLADDWEENRQTCIDVLCAYLRLPHESDPGQTGAATVERRTYLEGREVRHTVMRVITAHLRGGANFSWQGMDFDFTGTIFDGAFFEGAEFSGVSRVSFVGAEFSGDINFEDAKFSAGRSEDAESSRVGPPRGYVSFTDAKFSDSEVLFRNAEFFGRVYFDDAKLSDCQVNFNAARITDGYINFSGAEFVGCQVDFSITYFRGGNLNFNKAKFSGSQVSCDDAYFSGSDVYFYGTKFIGGKLDFHQVRSWVKPPTFDWDGPPPEVMLPITADGKSQ